MRRTELLLILPWPLDWKLLTPTLYKAGRQSPCILHLTRIIQRGGHRGQGPGVSKNSRGKVQQMRQNCEFGGHHRSCNRHWGPSGRLLLACSRGGTAQSLFCGQRDNAKGGRRG